MPMAVFLGMVISSYFGFVSSRASAPTFAVRSSDRSVGAAEPREPLSIEVKGSLHSSDALVGRNDTEESPACFVTQNASLSVTVGMMAKLYMGGGEAVDHSRVWPFQGSLPEGFCLRWSTLTINCRTWKAAPQHKTTKPQ